MTISIKSLALVTLTTLSLTSSVMISDASADTKPSRMKYRRPVQSEQTLKPSLDLKTKFSPIGHWQGHMYEKDIGEHIMQFIKFDFSSNKSGIWKVIGSKHNPQTDEWEEYIIRQGLLTPVIQGNEVTLFMNNWSEDKTIILKGEIKNNGSKIKGYTVSDTDYLFYVNRQ